MMQKQKLISNKRIPLFELKLKFLKSTNTLILLFKNDPLLFNGTRKQLREQQRRMEAFSDTEA